MPHLSVNRPRLHDLTSAHPELGNHYQVGDHQPRPLQTGGLMFVIGSELF